MSTPPTSAAQGHYVQVNGIQMYYEMHGEGTPLLLLHGFTQTSQDWHPFIADFAKHYHLIVPDLRGHGRSSNPSKQFTHRQVAHDIYALLDELHVEQCKCIGLSSGADVVLHMATQQPSRIESMVVVGTEIYYASHTRALYRSWTADSPIWNREKMREHHVLGDEQIEALIEQMAKFADSYDDMNFTPPHLATITAQTLIVQGDRDEYCPLTFATEMYSSIPHSYLWIVPNGSHMPFRGENASLFTKTALAFLRGDWVRTP